MNQATVTVPVGVSGGIRVQSRSHDEMDLEALYRTHYDDVYRYARARLACPDAAADVAQETFARAYQARAAGTRMANPRAWLLRTAMNLCVDHWRDQRRSAPLPDDLVSEERTDPEAAVVRAAEARRVHTALAVLPPKVRAALILRDIEREPVGAIAEMLGVTVGSASVALHRARGRARRAYEGARSLLAPSGLFDTVRRWVARTAQHGMPLTDSAGAVCASVCAAALVFAISVSMGEPEPAPRTIATQGRSRPVAVIHAAGRGETARQATPVGATAAALRSTRVPGPSADAPRATTSTEPEVAVPGTPVWASTKPPKAKKSVSIAVEREVAGQRVSAGADYYDDTGLVELVEDEPRALRP